MVVEFWNAKSFIYDFKNALYSFIDNLEYIYQILLTKNQYHTDWVNYWYVLRYGYVSLNHNHSSVEKRGPSNEFLPLSDQKWSEALQLTRTSTRRANIVIFCQITTPPFLLTVNRQTQIYYKRIQKTHTRYTFLSNHNINKSLCGLCFWAPDPLMNIS